MAWLPFLLVAGAFFAAFAPYSWHPTDYEALLGASWRVLGGKVPYRDFLYVRTPLSLYLHAPWLALPDGWGIWLARLAFYAQMAAAGAVPTSFALRRGWVRPSLPLFALSALFCALALHHFPPMPWYTVDGVFFGAIGLTCALAASLETRAPKAAWLEAAASLAFVAAALCKQNFAVFVVLHWLFVAWRTRGAWRPLVAAVSPALLVGALFLGWLVAAGAWADFVAQVLGASHGSDVVRSGLSFYLHPLVLGAFALGALALLPERMARLAGRARVAWARHLLLAGVVAAVVLAWGSFRYGPTAHIVFALGVGLLVGRLVTTPRPWSPEVTARFALHAGWLAIAWSAGISWGYATPQLGLVGLGVVFADTLPEEKPQRVWLLSAAVVVAVFALANARVPYRDQPRSAQSKDLGELFVPLRGIHTNPNTFDRYLELKTLIDQHVLSTARPFVVFFDYPLIHALYGQQSPVGIDWFWPPEYAGHEARLLRELRAARPLLFVQRERQTPFGEKGPPDLRPCPALGYPARQAGELLLAALQGAKPLGGGRYFCVFSM